MSERDQSEEGAAFLTGISAPSAVVLRRLAPFGLLALAAVLFGTVGISTRLLYNVALTNATSIGFLRLALGAPVLVVLALVLEKPDGAGKRRITARLAGLEGLHRHRDDLFAFLVAGLGVASYQVCYMSAVARIGVTATTLLAICTSPILIALLAILVLGERLTRTLLIALMLAVCGAGLLVGMTGSGPQAGGDPLSGTLLALGAALSYSVYAIISKRLVASRPPMTVMAISFSLGALLLLPAVPLLTGTGPILSYPFAGWLVLIYLGVVTIGCAYALYILGLRHTPATVAGIIGLCEPLTAAILAYAIFGEVLAPLALLGAGLLLAAIALLAFATERAEPETAN